MKVKTPFGYSVNVGQIGRGVGYSNSNKGHKAKNVKPKTK